MREPIHVEYLPRRDDLMRFRLRAVDDHGEVYESYHGVRDGIATSVAALRDQVEYEIQRGERQMKRRIDAKEQERMAALVRQQMQTPETNQRRADLQNFYGALTIDPTWTVTTTAPWGVAYASAMGGTFDRPGRVIMLGGDGHPEGAGPLPEKPEAVPLSELRDTKQRADRPRIAEFVR